MLPARWRTGGSGLGRTAALNPKETGRGRRKDPQPSGSHVGLKAPQSSLKKRTRFQQWIPGKIYPGSKKINNNAPRHKKQLLFSPRTFRLGNVCGNVCDSSACTRLRPPSSESRRVPRSAWCRRSGRPASSPECPARREEARPCCLFLW